MEGVYRETVINFDNDDKEYAYITTTYPYIAKQLAKEPDVIEVRHTHDPKTNVEDSWEFKVPLHWFFKEGRLRIPRRLTYKNESRNNRR